MGVCRRLRISERGPLPSAPEPPLSSLYRRRAEVREHPGPPEAAPGVLVTNSSTWDAPARLTFQLVDLVGQTGIEVSIYGTAFRPLVPYAQQRRFPHIAGTPRGAIGAGGREASRESALAETAVARRTWPRSGRSCPRKAIMWTHKFTVHDVNEPADPQAGRRDMSSASSMSTTSTSRSGDRALQCHRARPRVRRPSRAVAGSGFVR